MNPSTNLRALLNKYIIYSKYVISYYMFLFHIFVFAFIPNTSSTCNSISYYWSTKMSLNIGFSTEHFTIATRNQKRHSTVRPV